MTTSTNSSSPGSPDPRSILDRAIATGGSVIAAVRPENLTDATPCPDLDVRSMLGHLVGVLDRIAALGSGGDPFAVVESPAPGDDWPAAWASSARRAAGAWRSDAVLERSMVLPWIRGSGAEVLASYVSELTVHTWDLATAIGRQPDWDEAVLAAALGVRPILPAADRRAVFAEISAAMGFDEVAIPFADAVPVPQDAPTIDRLVAWNGRDPRR